jgi:hypothetical protein
MGTLKYDGTTVEFDDRLLAHLEVVTIQKLRRQEAFFMSWRDPDAGGGGRTGIWVHPAVLLTFHFTTDDRPPLDRAWIEKLAASASSPGGLFVMDPDGQPLRASEPTDFD